MQGVYTYIENMIKDIKEEMNKDTLVLDIINKQRWIQINKLEEILAQIKKERTSDTSNNYSKEMGR